MTLTPADLARLKALASNPKKFREHFGHKIGSVEIPAMRGDNLAVCLCSFFEDPDEISEDDTGWGPSAIAGYEATRDAIHDVYASTILALIELAEKK